MPTSNGDNRTRILDQALTLFAARGYDAIGVQEICSAVGVTKPTLYHYFHHKRGLLTALVQERCAPLLAELRLATRYSGDLPLSLQRVVSTYFEFATREPVLYRLLLALWFVVPTSEAFEVILTLNIEQHRLVEELFAVAVEDHGNMRGRQRMYAATLLGMVNTYIGMALNGYLDLNTAMVHQAVHQFSHGIYS